MLRVLLISHGRLAEALLETAEGILGAREGVEAVSNHGLSRDGLVEILRERIAALPEQDALLLLVDMPGGSTHVAARLALAGQPAERAARLVGPLTGMNLPLLLTLLNRRESTPLPELLPLLLDRGRAAIHVQETR
jgi:mannose/fructose-specific phosphotransferase system component IIA